METKIIDLGDKKLAEFLSTEVIIKNVQDALDLMANSPTNYIVLHERNFEKNFFDLSTRIAGEILQKFTNYHVKLAIIGDFSKYKSKSLKAFIYESNKNKEYLFVDSIEEVKKIW
jgi:hypothetical protein